MDETLTLRKVKKFTIWKLKIRLDKELMEMRILEIELKQKYKEMNLTLNLRSLIDLTIIHHDFALISVSVVSAAMTLGKFLVETPLVRNVTPPNL